LFFKKYQLVSQRYLQKSYQQIKFSKKAIDRKSVLMV